jgi:hypothetical protein
MNINVTLRDIIEDYYDKYNLDTAVVQEFLIMEPRNKRESALEKYFAERRGKAAEIIRFTTERHGKQTLKYLTDELARVEYGIRSLQRYIRDHVVHSVLTYILGIYINEKFALGINPIQWKIASLFHDIGYPIEIANKLLNETVEIPNTYIDNLELQDVFKKYYMRLVPHNLTDLKSNLQSIPLIQRYIDQSGLSVNAKREYQRKSSYGIHDSSAKSLF